VSVSSEPFIFMMIMKFSDELPADGITNLFRPVWPALDLFGLIAHMNGGGRDQ
jgi:hypothetical protein